MKRAAAIKWWNKQPNQQLLWENYKLNNFTPSTKPTELIGREIEKLIADRLEYLRGEIEQECISYAEIAELQSLKDFIAEDDVLLRQWAGIPEN